MRGLSSYHFHYFLLLCNHESRGKDFAAEVQNPVEGCVRLRCGSFHVWMARPREGHASVRSTHAVRANVTWSLVSNHGKVLTGRNAHSSSGGCRSLAVSMRSFSDTLTYSRDR